ncbi:MAG: hypothetical protein HKN44_01455 [Ilumatobacter sp.]|nr:hypothetical protein [Ilumatobacter sp.]
MEPSPVVAALDKVLREHRVFREDPDDTEPERQQRLYWWTVPERPGVGTAMLRGTLVWFVSLAVLVAVVGSIAR